MKRQRAASSRVTRSKVASMKNSLPKDACKVWKSLEGTKEEDVKDNKKFKKRKKIGISKDNVNGNDFSNVSVAKRMQKVLNDFIQKEDPNRNVRKDISAITTTQGGWCLLKGLIHVASAHDGILLPVIEKHGIPPFYLTRISNSCRHEKTPYSIKTEEDNYQSFRMLCRIIAGQQLAIAAAKSIWTRLLKTVGGHLENPLPLVPKKIIDIASLGDDEIENKLRKPAGLSNSKLKSIIDLAQHFESGYLSDEYLLRGSSQKNNKECNEDDYDVNIRNRLFKVKGIGPWTCDMFLIFHSQSPNILALGDLGVRKGTSVLFNMKGNGKNGTLCEKKDGEALQKLHRPFAPYRSLSTYYMWRCVESTTSNKK